MHLVGANLLRSELIRRTVEVPGECSHHLHVRGYCSLGVITTLELFQHHLSKMGHRDLLVTHTLRQLTLKCLNDTHAKRVGGFVQTPLPES